MNISTNQNIAHRHQKWNPNLRESTKEKIISSQRQRRQALFRKLEVDQEKGLHCASCSGICCRSPMNSMKLSLLEAVDIVLELQKNASSFEDVLQACSQSIEDYQLARPVPGDGRRTFLRRRYTCPLFQHKSLGCPLPFAAKPYGCLGFNPLKAGVEDGEACAADIPALEERELSHPEEPEIVKELEQEWGITWEKTSIPEAILQVSGILDRASQS